MRLEKHAAGWAAEVLGQTFDLDDLRVQLAPPFDPWVEEDESSEGNKLLLRSTAWNLFADAGPVHALAARLLEQINGAMPIIQDDAEPLRLGAVIQFDELGTRHTSVLLAGVSATLGNARIRATVSNGKTAATLPRETRL